MSAHRLRLLPEAQLLQRLPHLALGDRAALVLVPALKESSRLAPVHRQAVRQLRDQIEVWMELCSSGDANTVVLAGKAGMEGELCSGGDANSGFSREGRHGFEARAA